MLLVVLLFEFHQSWPSTCQSSLVSSCLLTFIASSIFHLIVCFLFQIIIILLIFFSLLENIDDKLLLQTCSYCRRYHPHSGPFICVLFVGVLHVLICIIMMIIIILVMSFYSSFNYSLIFNFFKIIDRMCYSPFWWFCIRKHSIFRFFLNQSKQNNNIFANANPFTFTHQL